MVAPAIGAALVGAGSSLVGGLLGNRNNRSNAQRQEAIQREFAQNGLQWKVEDAKKAGLHPLAALGASGASYTPVQVGDALGPALSNAGQDISRGMLAAADRQDRETIARAAAAEHQARMDQFEQQRLLGSVEYESRMIDNELKRLQLRKAMSQVGPGIPTGPQLGAPQFGSVKVEPSKQTSADPLVPGREAFVGEGKPAMVPYRIGTKDYGFTLDVPGSEFGEGLEGGGPAAWLLGASGIGGHYAGKALQMFQDWSRDWLKRNPPQFRRGDRPRGGR